MRRLLTVLAAEVLAVVFTSRAAAAVRDDLGADPLVGADLGEVLVAVVHLGAWAASWWLLVGTLHDVVVTARGRGPRGRRLAPAWVQRVVVRAVGTSLVLALASGPAAAVAAPSQPAAAQDADPHEDPAPGPAVVLPPVQPVPLPGTTPVPVAPVTPAAAQTATDEGPAPEDPAPDSSGPTSHVVAAGENLWVIARAVVAGASAEPPSDRDVHASWVRLIAANDVASGDPDLIHPGEVLHLPSTGGEG